MVAQCTFQPCTDALRRPAHPLAARRYRGYRRRYPVRKLACAGATRVLPTHTTTRPRPDSGRQQNGENKGPQKEALGEAQAGQGDTTPAEPRTGEGGGGDAAAAAARLPRPLPPAQDRLVLVELRTP